MGALLAPPRARFRASIAPIGTALGARMAGRSWRGDDARCPVLAELGYVTVDHVTFAGAAARGELVVAAAIADATVELFRRLWQLGFPIRQLRLVDDFGAADDASMAADNSSAFNFRCIAGTELLSQHARGRAIDLNPVENPWRREPGLVPDLVPEVGRAFADRRDVRPGMIVRPGPVVAALDELGWEWGGDWRHAHDDHHIVRVR